MSDMPIVYVDFNAIRGGNRVWGRPDQPGKLQCGQTVCATDVDDLQASATVIAVRFGISGQEIVEVQVDPDSYQDITGLP